MTTKATYIPRDFGGYEPVLAQAASTAVYDKWTGHDLNSVNSTDMLPLTAESLQILECLEWGPNATQLIPSRKYVSPTEMTEAGAAYASQPMIAAKFTAAHLDFPFSSLLMGRQWASTARLLTSPCKLVDPRRDEILAELRELETTENGWAGPGTFGPLPDTVRDAMTFLQMMPATTRTIEPVLTEEGHIILELFDGDLALGAIEFVGNSVIHVGVVRNQQIVMLDTLSATHPARLIIAARRITDLLA